jgi:phospholipid/cholesterol/gamma-HCH transport system substrate-binding protein
LHSSLETRVGIFVIAAAAIFMYMGFQIGSFRFDKSHYRSYSVYFKDISGVSRKSAVKIAGVKVGWVESVALVPDHEMMVDAQVMILSDYKLYSDAYAIVRQEGLLGPKYLEIIPGDPLLSPLEEGEALKKSSRAPVAVDEIMRQVKTITANMEDITDSFKNAIGGLQGKEKMYDIVDNLSRAAERLASFSATIDRAIGRNDDNIDNLFSVGSDIRRLAEKIETQLLPSLQYGVDSFTGAMNRDFNRIASSLESTAGSFDEASMQVRDGLRNFNSVVEKIDEGKGLLGKLINEDETYRDFKVTAKGLKDYFAAFNRMQVVVDSHFERMQRPGGEHWKYDDAKGYVHVRIHPNDDYFYLLEFVTSEKGFIDRRETHRSYFDHTGRFIDPDMLSLTDFDKLRFVYDKKKTLFDRGALRFGVQFGKIFKDIALRFGIFDSTAGAAIDFDIPFKTEKLRWVTSFEAFDFTGWNRQHDRRPHLKWINRIYMFGSLYINFGADDFISKHNASAFVGAGLRFGSEDVR